MAATSILIVEDEAAIRESLREALTRSGFTVEEAASVRQALEASFATVDLVLLDLMLPDGDGLDVLAAIRRDKPFLPVILLTAKGEQADRVSGLRSGADDYIVKPFGVDELLARIEAVLRRSVDRRENEETIEVAGRTIDLARREIVQEDGSKHTIPEREFELLVYLANHHDRIVSRDELLARVWGVDPRGLRTRSVDMAVARLRELLGDDSQNPRVIATVRGRGYMLVRSPAEANDR